MTKTIKLAGASLMILPLLVAASVLAKAVAPATPKPGSSFAQRLEQRKQERQIKLSQEDKQRLVEQCRSAQTNIRVLQTNTTTITDNRLAIYKDIDAKLWIVTGQLKLADKDTFALEKIHSRYVKKVAALKVTTTDYQQVLDDLTIINCRADVVGFKALLNTARLYYTDIRNQSKDIRKFVINSVKPSLTDYSGKLQPASSGSQQ